jgi:uracil-DNA glycosylase
MEGHMQISDFIQCKESPCSEARQESYLVPRIEIDPQSIKLLLISETAPTEPKDDYYASGDALFARTTLQAFQEAGLTVNSIDELVRKGIYLTTAVKCGKNDYSVATNTVVNCSYLLENELTLFPEVRAYLLMGDVAIKALNTIAKRQGEPRVVTAGSTYKIREGVFTYRGKRVFPSYLQAGPSFGIEKSKQRMIAQDLANALMVAGIE